MDVRDRGARTAPVLVLSFSGTGLATVRCLARGGMPVHAAVFPRTGEGLEVRRSRCCHPVNLPFSPDDEDALLRWLRAFCWSLDDPLVVFPTSDATALFLAKHRPALRDAVVSWETRHDELSRIVRKDGLYRAAIAAGVRVPPTIVAPSPGDLAAWCRENPPPYFVKPFYSTIAGCALGCKNRVFSTVESLSTYAETAGLHNALVQRQISSGDGRVYDAYGLCGRDGQPWVLASHRRVRQYPADTGATSHGEIPMGSPRLEDDIFRNTLALLSCFRYHGIFGIEWLHERSTGALYLADFNARPFSSIGHLADSGLNLPLLAYDELLGRAAPPAVLAPRLARSTWVDFNNDVRSFRHVGRARGQSWADFALSVARCRSFAYFDARDPGPWLHRALELGKMVLAYRRRARAKRRAA